jgi:hypothetical protein
MTEEQQKQMEHARRIGERFNEIIKPIRECPDCLVLHDSIAPCEKHVELGCGAFLRAIKEVSEEIKQKKGG